MERRIYDNEYVDELKVIENKTIISWRDITREWDDESRKFVKRARRNSPEAREDEAWLLYRTSMIEEGRLRDIQRMKSMILNLRDKDLERIIRSFY